MSKAKRWKPKEDELFYYIKFQTFPIANVAHAHYWDGVYAQYVIDGNCFQTKKEAQAAARKLKAFWKDVREGR